MRTTEVLPAHSSVYILKPLPDGFQHATMSLNVQSSHSKNIYHEILTSWPGTVSLAARREEQLPYARAAPVLRVALLGELPAVYRRSSSTGRHFSKSR